MSSYNGSFFNHQGQTKWNLTRLNKLGHILTPDWFNGKSIIEVAAGHGVNGRALITMGAEVTFTDGRPYHVNFLKTLGLNAHVMDQDQPWTIHRQFDLIVHWGVLYHLKNWRRR